jgi:phosphate transport system substrate-binding protein
MKAIVIKEEHLMQHLRSRSLALACLLAIVAVAGVFAACGDDDDAASNTPAPTAAGSTTAAATTPAGGGSIDYGSLSGTINIAGSSTVFPITDAMAEDFDAVASDVLVNVASTGTGAGFEAFCAGEIDISDASRPISEDEIATCAGAGIDDILELQVGIDALTVMVHPSNDFATCLTIQQLFNLFSATRVTNWNQVDPAFPDEDIGDSLYYPGQDSGTYDYFVEVIIDEIDETASHTSDGTASEDDNLLATGIEGDPNSIGYFGFAYFQGAGAALKAVAVDGGEGCVEPSFDAALDGSYAPLSRPLYIYTRESFLEDPESPVLGFLNFYMEQATVLVEEVGYVSMPEDELAAQNAKLEPFLP